MSELSLKIKRVQIPRGRKRIWNENGAGSCVRKDCSTHWHQHILSKRRLRRDLRYQSLINLNLDDNDSLTDTASENDVEISII